MYSYGPPQMAEQKQDDRLKPTYSSWVKTRDVTLKTCRRRWMIGRSGERWSGMSVLAARHDDDDDICSIQLLLKATENSADFVELGGGFQMPTVKAFMDDTTILSSSSSSRAISTDISDPLSPPLPIVHCFWQVFRATFTIGTYVCM